MLRPKRSRSLRPPKRKLKARSFKGGIANQRIAIANGLKQSVEEVRGAMEEGTTGQHVMNMLL